jgi:hypothetical protein
LKNRLSHCGSFTRLSDRMGPDCDQIDWKSVIDAPESEAA